MQDPKGANKRPTLRDVAKLAGVDPSAVSRLINDDPRLSVSSETRDRIVAAIRKLDYRPNMTAKGLRLARTWTIGFILPALSNPLYESMVRGAQQAAERAGYGLVLGSEASASPSPTFPRLLHEGRVDGLLVASGSLSDDLLREMAEGEAGPVVVVNRRIPGVPSTVVVDDAGASDAAVAHLLGLGHRKIVALIGPPDLETSRRRLAGFRSALDGGAAEGVVVEARSWTASAGREAMAEALERWPEVTGAFASTLMMGIGALSAAHEHGLQVPGQLSLICLHDSELARFTQPPLSTVALPAERMGEAAAELLIRIIDGGDSESTMVPGFQLIERRSTIRPRPAS